MRAEIVNFEWPDLDLADPRAASMTLLVVVARPIGSQGGETFGITVCTPAGLSELLDRDGAVVGRHYLFVPVINTERVESVVQDRLRRLDGETWTELAQKIARLGHWEFEDYTEYK